MLNYLGILLLFFVDSLELAVKIIIRKCGEEGQGEGLLVAVTVEEGVSRSLFQMDRVDGELGEFLTRIKDVLKRTHGELGSS